jgi:hypothetical protein
MPKNLLERSPLNCLQYQITIFSHGRKRTPGPHLTIRVTMPFWNMDLYLCCIVRGLHVMGQFGIGHIGMEERYGATDSCRG